MDLLDVNRSQQGQLGDRRTSSASTGRLLARRCAAAGLPAAHEAGSEDRQRRPASVFELRSEQQQAVDVRRSISPADSTPHNEVSIESRDTSRDKRATSTEASPSKPRWAIRSVSVVAKPRRFSTPASPMALQRSMSVLPPGSRRPSAGSIGKVGISSSKPSSDVPDGMRLAAGSSRIEELDEVTDSENDDGDDIFAPTDERVQTIDFTRIRTQSIQITKNELRGKADNFKSLKRQVKNFFYESRTEPMTDEQGNVELPMYPCVQSRDDHDSGLLTSQRLFRLARHEQLELQDRSTQHKRQRHEPGETVDDYEFAWIVKRASQSPVAAAASSTASDGHHDDTEDGIEKQSKRHTTGNTYKSKVGSNTVEFRERVDAFLRIKKKTSVGNRSDYLLESEHARARRAQLLGLYGLVEAPTSDALSEEERGMLRAFLLERYHDPTDNGGTVEERFPCNCCGPDNAPVVESRYSTARYYYDLLFANRKNDSFTVRFDLVHCLPRFLLHYKFHKRLYDCLDATERQDLVKAATDIVLSYNLNHCTLQMPYGKYRTNAFPAFFVYIIVPDPARYLEIFEVCNPPVKPGERQKKNSCAIPNWPDKSYVTEFWTYSKESSSPSDKDPRLASSLYEKNVRRKLQLVQMPELLVTRRNPPPELAMHRRRSARQQRGDFDIFEDFVLIPHQELPMLGFGSVQHPAHASDSRSGLSDIKFLDRLLHAMNSYVRKHVNTRQRRLDGKEDLSCTVNLSLQHSYAFKGHQRVYGFIGFPPASTFWTALAEEQRQNAALAEAAVTHEDIRQLCPTTARKEREEGTSETGGRVAATAASVKSEGSDDLIDAMREKLNSCCIL